jgi:hypothetical protein
MTFAQRFLLTLIIILVILFALAAFGYFTGRWGDDAEAQTVPPSKYDKRIAELDREAIDEAYKEKIIALFNTWLSDPSEQPSRAVRGAQNARRAYIGAMIEIEKREGK